MLPLDHPDRIQISFDDHRLVANAGLILPVTLAQHLGLRELVQQCLDLGNAPGRANTGDKMMTLVASAQAGQLRLPAPRRPGLPAPGRRGVRGPLHPDRRTLRAAVVGHHVKPGLLRVGAHLCQPHGHRRSD